MCYYKIRQKTLIAFIMIILLSGIGFACTCAPITAEEELQQADMVFAGKVITDKEMFPEIVLTKHFPFLHFSPWRKHEAVIQVSHIWKGSFSEKIQINYFPNEMCGPDKLKEEEEYLVFAYKKDDDLRIYGCSLTRQIKHSEEELAILGKGMMISSKPSSEGIPNQLTIALTIVVAGLICAGWLLMKKLRNITNT